mgnify:CR=1 FL=1
MPTQIDPNNITWDNAPQQQNAGPQGGVIITDPTVATEEERAERAEGRDEARLGLSQESNARQASNDQFGRISTYRTEFNNNPLVREFRDIENATQQILTLANVPEGEDPGLNDIGLITSYMKALDPGSVVREGEFATASNAGGVPTRIRTLYNGIKDGGKLTPEQRQEMARIAVDLYDSRARSYNRFAETYRGLLEGEGANPDEQGVMLAEELTFGGDDANDGLQLTGTSDTEMTAQDLELQGRLREAYGAGATLEELQAITGEYGRSFPITSQEQLDAARREGRQINITPTGNRSALDNFIGGIADSPGGAYFMGAANGLLSGGMDELAPLLGMDAQQTQMAKEAMRERYPVSSFVGETTGLALQQAGATKALGAAGMGARGSAVAAEVGGGAAYGAGEENDNRLLGAAVGGGTAYITRRMLEGLTSPQADEAIERIAEQNNTTPEAVRNVLTDLASGGDDAAMREGGEQIGEVATEALTLEAQGETADLARRAIGIGPGATKARTELARNAQIDPAARASAERLDMDLPVDIISDDARLKNLTGLARSQVGTGAEASWQATVQRVAQRAEDVVAEIGATRDLAQISDDVMKRLDDSMKALETQGATLRRQVDEAIDVRGRADASNLQREIADLINNYGGIAEARNALTGPEKRLLAMLGEGEEAIRPTYARLNRLRDEIGDALNKNKGPWVDVPRANLTRYYRALADDQLAAVRAQGGDELAEQFRASNELFTRMFTAREEMTDLFGRNLEKSLAPALSRAITKGGKGDVSELSNILDRIPADMQGPAVLSALLNNSKSRASHGGFSFANFEKTYRGLREQGPVFRRVADAIGPEGVNVLNDVYAVARRMADGERRVLTTGKSNQALLSQMQADGLVRNIVSNTARRTGVNAVGAGVGSVAGGPVGAAAGMALSDTVQEAITRGGRDRLQRLHELLSGSEFRALAEELANGEASTAAVNRLANSGPFVKFGERLGLTTQSKRADWIRRAMTSTATVGVNRALPGEDTPSPQTTIEVQ